MSCSFDLKFMKHSTTSSELNLSSVTISLESKPASISNQTHLTTKIISPGSDSYKYKLGFSTQTNCKLDIDYSTESSIGNNLDIDLPMSDGEITV